MTEMLKEENNSERSRKRNESTKYKIKKYKNIKNIKKY